MAGDDKSMQDLVAALRASGPSASTLQQQPPSSGGRAPRPATESAPDRTANLLDLLRFNQTSQQQQQQQQQTPPAGSQASPATGVGPGNGHPGLSASMLAAPGGGATQNIHGRGVSASDLVASFMGKPSANAASSRDITSPAAASSPTPSANAQDYLLQLLNRSQMGHSPSSPAPPLAPPPTTRKEERHSRSREATDSDSQRKSSESEDASGGGQLASGKSAKPAKSEASREATQGDKSKPAKAAPKAEAAKGPIFTYVNPFEQLAASSPRNRSGASTPRKDAPTATRGYSEVVKGEEKLDGRAKQHSGHGQGPGAEAKNAPRHQTKPNATAGGSGSTAAEIGAPTTDPETVSQALNQVSEQVSRQADFALACAEEESNVHTTASNPATQQRVDADAPSVTSGKTKETWEGYTPSTGYSAIPTMANKGSDSPSTEYSTIPTVATQGDSPPVEGHGSADDEKSSANGASNLMVPVYNFVMKPFVSINLVQPKLPTLQFREDAITEIARLKKEFDQIDRTLTTASAEYIIYSLPKFGGIRVIRQDDGQDRQLFKENKDYVFNVSISTPARTKNADDLQTSIATAASGTVYWTELRHDGDNFDSPNLRDHSLIFPPVSPNDEHAAGGQLKSRAKRSSRHPEFFAIGRGKLIQVVFPLHASRSAFVDEDRVVDTNAYFKDRSLKINTGKAGKDFTFSEDDTVVATLDKAGRLRFWDVRELTHELNGEASVLSPIEIRTPILTLSTAIPSEKSWPTSVLFVDKMRAYAKGAALRYVIVGMKQNHTLQLWDLGIGKAIQEVHFPHSHESDAICSVCYHASSGIIVVGHPTRNSIYFIHLSAPKYNLPGMTQARYLTRLADKDTALPKLEATAIMSGMREYSFSAKGQLRSVDLLAVTPDTVGSKDEPGLFELYVMHSKGVTMLNIHREDLGWSEDMKVLNPIDAQEEGIIQIKELVQPPTTITSENSSVNGDAAPIATGSKKTNAIQAKSNDKGTTDDTDLGESKERIQQEAAAPTDKAEKRKKKKAAHKDEDVSTVPPPAPVAPTLFSGPASKGPHQNQNITHSKDVARQSVKKTMGDFSDSKVSQDPITLDVSTDFIDKELKRIELSVSEEFKKALERELGLLYKRISDDRQVRDAQHGADREALLRLIAKHLGENLEAALEKIVSDSMERQIVPSFQEVITRALQQGLNSTLTESISDSVSSAVLQNVRKSLQSPEWISSIATSVTRAPTEPVQFKYLHDSVNGIQEQLSDKASKIEQLTRTIDSLHDTIRTMATSQQQLLHEVAALKDSSPLKGTEHQDTQVAPPKGQIVDAHPEIAELRAIKELMESGEYEDATIKWLQTKQQAEIFDNYFVKLEPYFTRQFSSLVNLSVAAAVTSSLEHHLGQKVRWLATILSSINYNEPDIREVAPKIIDVIYQRLEHRNLQLAKKDPQPPLLNQIEGLMRKVDELSQLVSRS